MILKLSLQRDIFCLLLGIRGEISAILSPEKFKKSTIGKDSRILVSLSWSILKFLGREYALG